MNFSIRYYRSSCFCFVSFEKDRSFGRMFLSEEFSRDSEHFLCFLFYVSLKLLAENRPFFERVFRDYYHGKCILVARFLFFFLLQRGLQREMNRYRDRNVLKNGRDRRPLWNYVTLWWTRRRNLPRTLYNLARRGRNLFTQGMYLGMLDFVITVFLFT